MILLFYVIRNSWFTKIRWRRDLSKRRPFCELNYGQLLYTLLQLLGTWTKEKHKLIQPPMIQWMFCWFHFTGEDRWLCTLLLKQKYRVDYCAASDALTFAPEGFYEFYKQRRRWAPSTMANILDLLLDGDNVRKNNQNISRPYIFYHICLFISSILTPGTIFLLILGAIITAFPSIEPWAALLFNGLPLAIFIISIFLAKEDTQVMTNS